MIPKKRVPTINVRPLEGLGLSPAGARILRYFLLRPDGVVHHRELQRALELGGASVQRELDRLVDLGALQRREDGRRVEYSAVTRSPVWDAVRMLEANASDPAPLLSSAFLGVHGVEAAFMFGSFARGTQRQDSDVDVFVVESPDADRKTLFRQLGQLELVLGREVNAVRYTQRSLAERLGQKGHPGRPFVREALLGPKKWVAGDVSSLAPLAIAAGLELPESAHCAL